MWPKRVAKKRVRLAPEMAFLPSAQVHRRRERLANPFQRRFIAGNKK
jgi:hypothetical protein